MPTDTPITEGLLVNAEKSPSYKVSEVARWFFGKSAHWLRWCERKGHLTEGDVTIGGRDDVGTARSYNLNDVERMAHRLAERGAISPRHAELALEAVRIQVEIFAMADDPYEFEGVSYPLTVDEVALRATRSPTWVRAHAVSLGGVRRQWDETRMQESWRFAEDGLDLRIQSTLEPSPGAS